MNILNIIKKFFIWLFLEGTVYAVNKSMDYYKYTLQNLRESCALDITLIEKGENFYFCTTLQEGVLIGPTLPLSAFNETNEGIILARYVAGVGPLYFSEGTVKFSFLLDKVDLDKSGFTGDYNSICKQWIIKSLKDLGIETTTKDKTNDIFLNGKKISGAASKDMGDKLFFGAFIALFIDFEVGARVINIKKHVTDLAERAIGINQVLETSVSAEQIFNSLKNNANELWGIGLKNPIDTSIPIPNFQKNIDIQNDDNWIKYGRSQKPDFS